MASTSPALVRARIAQDMAVFSATVRMRGLDRQEAVAMTRPGCWLLVLIVATLAACATGPERRSAVVAQKAAPAAGGTGAGLSPADPTPTLKRQGDRLTTLSLPPRSRTADISFHPDPLPRGAMAVHAINVGQGDAFLVEFVCGAALIDTGLENRREIKERLAAYLAWFFEERRPDLNNTLSLAVISHSHADHAAGVPIVLGDAPAQVALSVRNVIDNGYDIQGGKEEQDRLRQSRTDGYQAIRVDEILWYEGATSDVIDPIRGCDADPEDPLIRVLWGGWEKEEGAPVNPNHHSVVVRIDYGQASFLFTGDLQLLGRGDKQSGLESLLEDYAGDPSAFDVDVLKVAHHGAENGTNDALLGIASPCIAMLGSGDPRARGTGTAHDHGHPRKSTLELLTSDTTGVTGSRPKTRIDAAPGADQDFVPFELNNAVFGPPGTATS